MNLRIFDGLRRRHLLDWLPDRVYLQLAFRAFLGKPLRLKHPQTLNEKLQWLKLYDRKPEYTMMVDKYRVRDYIKAQLGEEYLIPLLGVWDDPDDIDFDALPNQFVLKCNHNSGLGMCICKDKSQLDIPAVKAELRKGLAQNYYLTGREWPYKDVPRKIICEKYMVDESGTELKDYKIDCFNGQAKIMLRVQGRFSGSAVLANYYTRDRQELLFRWGFARNEHPQPWNPAYDEMFALADRLSRNIPHLRVDFYLVNGRIYFGELTFFDGSGFDKIEPETWDYTLGSYLQLPEKDR